MLSSHVQLVQLYKLFRIQCYWYCSISFGFADCSCPITSLWLGFFGSLCPNQPQVVCRSEACTTWILGSKCSGLQAQRLHFTAQFLSPIAKSVQNYFTTSASHHTWRLGCHLQIATDSCTWHIGICLSVASKRINIFKELTCPGASWSAQ